MRDIIYLSGIGLFVLGFLISAIGYILTKRGGSMRWKYWLVGMIFIGVGLAIQIFIEGQNA